MVDVIIGHQLECFFLKGMQACINDFKSGFVAYPAMQNARSDAAIDHRQFDHWNDLKIAEDYLKYRPEYQDVVIPWVLDFYRRKNPSSAGSKIPLAIDVACGPGPLTAKLAPSCDRVIGVDISEEMLAVAKKNNAPANTEYRLGSAFDLSRVCSGEKADVITVGEAISFFDNDTFYAEVKKCLKPGGVFAAMGYTYIGVSVDGLENILGDYLREQFAGTHIWKVTESLDKQYRDVKLPFNCTEHYETTVPYPATREKIKGLLMSVHQIMNDGVEGIERLGESLPVEGSFHFTSNIFAIVALD